ncbi:MAG TPA: inositol monophosphatase family protein [Verrucomicrobiae bacterium]|nr:inositol monophosphatase family protein [Verrucomicrobiae bacterium]
MAAIARYAAQAGAAVVRAAGLDGSAAERKAPGDYVTATDHEAQAVILRVLAAATPNLPVLAEEAAAVDWERWGPTGAGWVVDPLDGTTNFTRGFPLVGVSVALLESGAPVAGAISAPFLGRSWHGFRGGGAFDEAGRRLRVGSRPGHHAVVATGFPFKAPGRRAGYLRMLAEVLERVEDVRRPGAASLDLAFTAEGVFDGFFELGLRPWDIAAGALLVREAGGMVTDWGGGDDPLAEGDILAASPEVHASLRAAVVAAGPTTGSA